MGKRIGEYLLEKGLITSSQIDKILAYSGRTGMRFGDAALELKYIDREQLVEVFGKNSDLPFFHLESSYFPDSTKTLLSLPEMLKFGALPLGIKMEKLLLRKKRVLNVGVLDASHGTTGQKKMDELKKLILSRFKEVDELKFFLILADQYIGILYAHYDLTDEQLKKIPSSEMDSVLAMFLDKDEK